MLYEAVYWRDDSAEERPSFDAMMEIPELRRYVEAWGRDGDVAIVALDRRDEPVGAAWYRMFDAGDPGYGFVANGIPELAIAVYPEYRRQRIGELLLTALLHRAEADGIDKISLSVAPDNPARRLYERHGFSVVNETPDALTMLASLA